MKKLLFIILSSLFLSNIALAGMSDADKTSMGLRGYLYG